jgi:hypothetical protein
VRIPGKLDQKNDKQGAEKARDILPGGGHAGIDSPKEGHASKQELARKAEVKKLSIMLLL